MRCIGDPLNHGVNGLGNQLYAIANNAVLAQKYNAMLAISSPIVRSTFSAPRSLPRTCERAREWSHKALMHRNVSTRWWYWEADTTQPLRPRAMHDLFAGRYSKWVQHELHRIRATLPPLYTVIHLRTWPDRYCGSKQMIGMCGQCLPTRTLECVHKSVLGTVALLFTDYDGDAMRERLVNRGNTVEYRTEREIFPIGFDLRNFSLTTIKSKRTLAGVLWALAYEAPLFIGSASSTLSKSVAMARLDHKPTILSDMRCRRELESDGPLFACTNATPSQLV